MTLSDEAFEELRAEFRKALPDLIAGKPDRTDWMKSIERASNKRPRVYEIIAAVSYASGFDFMAIVGNSTAKQLAKARVVVVCLANELRPDLSQASIAESLKKDRAIVRKALHYARDLKCNDNDFVHWCAQARRRLGYA